MARKRAYHVREIDLHHIIKPVLHVNDAIATIGRGTNPKRWSMDVESRPEKSNEERPQL